MHICTILITLSKQISQKQEAPRRNVVNSEEKIVFNSMFRKRDQRKVFNERVMARK